ncbi:MAG TPA: methyltransferase domain-containing protein [Nitrospirota bacterium]|nr:methyltransferase domain-containing protein [Nitrospirota bacterium]
MPQITFGIIVLNGEPFVKYNLRALYPFAHQIIVVEGAAPAAKAVASANGHSLDGTLEAVRRFKTEDDIESKVTIVTAEDEGHPDGFWAEKDEMSRAYAMRATGNYLWQIDADEFYLPKDIQTVIDMLSSDPEIKTISFPMYTFWGAPDYLVNGFFLEKFSVHRLFAWGSGYQYTTHRPPTVIDDKLSDLRKLKWITAGQMKSKGMYLFHYELLFPKQVIEKCRYYASVGWTSELRQADDWANKCYLTITKPFRVHMMYGHLSWLERFRGEHPPQVTQMMTSVASGVFEKVELRRRDDVESLLSDHMYLLKCRILKIVVPIDKGFAAMKAMARRLLKHSVIWKILQTTKRRLKGQLMPVEPSKVSVKLIHGWQAPSIPGKQRSLTIKELTYMYEGKIPLPYQVLADSIRLIHGEQSNIIEIGCSTGYHYEVLTHMLGGKVKYAGADYSYPMIVEAKKNYPAIPFIIADATALPYKDCSFDILISGCCLLHIPNYPGAISESARVSRHWVIFHRTPIVQGVTSYYQKKAYGIRCVEIHFNENEFIRLCVEQGLTMRYRLDISNNENSLYKTYIFEKT